MTLELQILQTLLLCSILIALVIVAAILDKSPMDEWKKVFGTLAVILILSAVVSLVLFFIVSMVVAVLFY